jgi:Leucine-rich repeat (LRR) protein
MNMFKLRAKRAAVLILFSLPAFAMESGKEEVSNTFEDQLLEIKLFSARLKGATQSELDWYLHGLELKKRGITDLKKYVIDLLNCERLENKSGLTESQKEMKKKMSIAMLTLKGNYLKTLPFDFAQLENLTSLNLAQNDFENIPSAIYDLTQLEKLFLYDNKIRSIDGVRVAKLEQLKVLDLWNNQIKKVPVELATMGSLEECNLAKNPLKEIPEAISAKKKVFILPGDKEQNEEQDSFLMQLCIRLSWYSGARHTFY